jgi:pimeloyl-ACP methyl ester carboxylesterase
VLVGHSIGGSYAMTCAARYPEQVAGLVLLDSSDPYQVTGTVGSTRSSAPSRVAVLPSVARLGIGQLVPTATWSSLPEPAAGQVAAFESSPRDPRWSAAQNRMAALSTTSSHRVADTTHVALLDGEREAGLSIRVLYDVIQAVRAGAPLPFRRGSTPPRPAPRSGQLGLDRAGSGSGAASG